MHTHVHYSKSRGGMHLRYKTHYVLHCQRNMFDPFVKVYISCIWNNEFLHGTSNLLIELFGVPQRANLLPSNNLS
jgi:hypothetical protein